MYFLSFQFKLGHHCCLEVPISLQKRLIDPNLLNGTVIGALVGQNGSSSGRIMPHRLIIGLLLCKTERIYSVKITTYRMTVDDNSVVHYPDTTWHKNKQLDTEH